MRRAMSWLLAAAVMAGCASTGVRTDRADKQSTQPANTPTTSGGPSTGSADSSSSPDGTPPDRTPPSPSPSPSPDTVPPTAAPGNTTGNPDGVGDTLFPELGNPGIDVQHYDVSIDYDHNTKTIDGKVGLDVRFTEQRGEFTLDAAGPKVSAVTIDGTDVTYRQDGAELRITPAATISSGAIKHVEVTYRVTGNTRSSASGLPSGWFDTASGSYVLDEPDATRTWLPSNDHPSDKATYHFTIHVATGVTAVANGTLADHTKSADGETWVWNEDQPMTTYLVQLMTGNYQIENGTGPHGIKLISAVLRDDVSRVQPYIDGIPEQIVYFETQFGSYPLESYGLAIIDSPPGLAMETQGRSLFSRDDLSGLTGANEALLLSHELAHQWFGDAVSPARWSDIWLNESFATYAEWMWFDHSGITPIGDSAAGALLDRRPGKTARPTVRDMFGYNVYGGGAVALHALRLTIGDDAFFTLLRRWVADNTGTSRTTEDFITLAEKVSGQDLTKLFADWIFADVVPTTFPKASTAPQPSTPIGSAPTTGS